MAFVNRTIPYLVCFNSILIDLILYVVVHQKGSPFPRLPFQHYFFEYIGGYPNKLGRKVHICGNIAVNSVATNIAPQT